ncbi:unnamed protein product, partial [Arabidopsis halleri]
IAFSLLSHSYLSEREGDFRCTGILTGEPKKLLLSYLFPYLLDQRSFSLVLIPVFSGVVYTLVFERVK